MDLCNDETFEFGALASPKEIFFYIDDLISAHECLIEPRHSAVSLTSSLEVERRFFARELY